MEDITLNARRSLWLLVLLAASLCASGVLAGCRKVEQDEAGNSAAERSADPGESNDRSGKTRPGPTAKAKDDTKADKPSVRLEREPWQSLLREAHRAEIDAGGLWIDLGGPTGELYTLGGWTRGWSVPEGGDGSSLVLTHPNAWLAMPPDTPDAAELVARLKGRCPGQTVKAITGEAPVSVLDAAEPPSEEAVSADDGTPVDVEWSIVRVPIPSLDALARLGLAVSEPSCESAEAEPGLLSVDWIYLASESAAAPPRDLVVGSANGAPTAGPINVGDRVRRGLAAPDSRSWRFFVQVPDDASLVVDLGSGIADMEFIVSVQADGEDERELLRETPPVHQWTEADVDLSAYAGKMVLLELTTVLPDGSASGESGWGEPSIMIPETDEDEAEKPKEPPAEEASDEHANESGESDENAKAPKQKEEARVLNPDATARNVVFIVIDTARADAFGPIPPNTVVKTPEYDELAARGTVFTAAWNNTNWTKPSVASMLSGLYPYVHGAQAKRDVLPEEIGLVSETLQNAGFSTGGFVSNGFISDRFGFERGWDTFTNYPREQLMQNARNVYEDTWEWVKETHRRDERVFAYIQTSDPHVPYWVGRRWSKMYYPDSYRGPIGEELDGHRQEELSGNHETLTEDDYNWIRALYFGEITYHDYHMGLFFDRLGSLDGFLDNTLVIVTNDHGEEVDDHGEMGHGHTLFDELVRAPLTMVFPLRIPAGVSVDTVVESVDIPVTLLELVGLEPESSHQGLSLAPLWESSTVPEMRRDATAVATWRKDKRAIRYGRYKLILSNDGSWASLFDLVNDPGETKDLLEQSPVARRALELRLADAHARPGKLQRFEAAGGRGQTFEARPTELDPALEKQLEALGYFGE